MYLSGWMLARAGEGKRVKAKGNAVSMPSTFLFNRTHEGVKSIFGMAGFLYLINHSHVYQLSSGERPTTVGTFLLSRKLKYYD
jgi:hypothetical protein